MLDFYFQFTLMEKQWCVFTPFDLTEERENIRTQTHRSRVSSILFVFPISSATHVHAHAFFHSQSAPKFYINAFNELEIHSQHIVPSCSSLPTRKKSLHTSETTMVLYLDSAFNEMKGS